MSRFFDYFYIAATISLTTYGQLILKWRIAKFGPPPDDFFEKLKFLTPLLLDPAIISSFAAAFLAGLAWMAVMEKFELSHAYPFMSLSFVIVMLLSGRLFGEPVTLQKALGVGLIVLGTVISARG